VESAVPRIATTAICASDDLREGTLDLRLLRVDDVAASQLDESLLDAGELRRADALARPHDRARYVATHVALRQLVGGYLGLEPGAVSFSREPCPHCGEPHGRPVVDGPSRALHFSLSYSGGLALIGIAPAPVGVDVERLAPRETIDEVSPLLHPAERAEIASAPRPDRPSVFTRIWTRKEAYLKGVGIGVTHDLAADYLGSGEGTPGPIGWTVISVPIAAGYAGAAAVRGPLSQAPS
jgi:4'-phosphopantetheinyl transferase